MSPTTKTRTPEQELKATLLSARIPASDHRIMSVLQGRAEWKTGVIQSRFQPRSLEQLADWCGLSLATVKRSLNRLDEHGWLVRSYQSFGGGRGRNTEYQLSPGRDYGLDRSKPPLPDAVRARQYRARKKAAHEDVTVGQPKPAHEDVTIGQKPAQNDVSNRLTSRNDAAAQMPFSAKSVLDVEVVVGESFQDQQQEDWRVWPPGSIGEDMNR